MGDRDAEPAEPSDFRVSVALPTYNRVDSLRRTVDSLLAQTHRHLEIVISDNASTDGTEAYCRDVAAADPRVRYLRNEVNLGPTPNFIQARHATTGPYFMWLADDDWLMPNYIATCVDELRRDPWLGLATGADSYYDGDRFDHVGTPVHADEGAPTRRVLDYYRQVGDNGAFYGLMPRHVVDATSEFQDRLGADWLFLAEVACLGGIRTVDSTTIYRSLAPQRTFVDLAGSAGLSWFEGHLPYVAIAWHVSYDISHGSPIYRSLGWRRLPLALRASMVIARRFIVTGLRWKSLKRRARSVASAVRNTGRPIVNR
jgi:glycosyltransferase involved in cell wall biosynthesis